LGFATTAFGAQVGTLRRSVNPEETMSRLAIAAMTAR
jgi:hypothetical protein